MNRVLLIGNLTKNPELRATSSGIPVCAFTLAVQRRHANEDGTKTADFLPIVVWRKAAENCAKYLRKGSQAAICGSLQTRSYDAADGTKRYITEIIADEVQFLSKPKDDSSDGGIPFGEEMQPVEDDEIPF